MRDKDTARSNITLHDIQLQANALQEKLKLLSMQTPNSAALKQNFQLLQNYIYDLDESQVNLSQNDLSNLNIIIENSIGALDALKNGDGDKLSKCQKNINEGIENLGEHSQLQSIKETVSNIVSGLTAVIASLAITAALTVSLGPAGLVLGATMAAFMLNSSRNSGPTVQDLSEHTKKFRDSMKEIKQETFTQNEEQLQEQHNEEEQDMQHDNRFSM